MLKNVREAGAATTNAPELAPPQPTIQEQGTSVQERDLLRMLLRYGHEKVMAPFFDPDRKETVEEETSVAELMFEMLAMDDILFDDPIFREIYLDYRHTSNLGEAVDAGRYVGHEQEQWRKTAIDLITEKHLLSPNWKDRHKIHVKRENEILFNALEEAVYILKERRLDRMIKDLQEKLKHSPEEEIMILLAEIKVKNSFKLQLSKKTGRVVVG